MSSKPILAGFILVLFFFLSCKEQTEYFLYRQIDKSRWYKDSILHLQFDSLSVSPFTSYNVDIEVTHDNSYPYRNLWLLVGHNLRDSVMQYDTVKFDLADAAGKWLGSGAGGLRQLSVPYDHAVRLDTTVSYRFSISQVMADNPLRGIGKIGIKISAGNK